jgi:hypothetical protein
MGILLASLLHIFISFTIVAFGIVSLFGINGTFDNWSSREVKGKKEPVPVKSNTQQGNNKSLYNIHL